MFFLALGLTSMFAVQIFTNLLVVLGLLPTTGIPLPFISYGGTFMIVSLFSVGVMFNISKESREII
jgi:cell division protein FtsW (lipid II flippase)